jgi:hypothetical protein
MTQPTPTPEKQPANPDENKNTQPLKGFFKRVREVLSEQPPIHPSEAEEIVIMPGEGEEDSHARD